MAAFAELWQSRIWPFFAVVAKNVFPAVQLSVFQETQHICLTVSTKAQQSVSWFSLIFGEQKQDHFLPQTVD